MVKNQRKRFSPSRLASKKIPLLIIVSAPSGSGKTTILKYLCSINKNLKYSISFTTREKRRGEKNGKHYHFIKKEEFLRLRKEGFFAEWAKVYGNYYGTSKKSIQSILSKGYDVVMDLDTKGAKSIKKIFRNAVTIFIMPPTIEELKKRLKKRKSDSDAEIEKRFSLAMKEISQISRYDYLVVNDNVREAGKKIIKIIEAEKSRVSRILND
ncbi:MAG: guanylate kinase [Candidatus Schekmanbacteria bacterium]|nr:MAG: guanylate kinase [Candidatus Schekmanbacteria bacterium]